MDNVFQGCVSFCVHMVFMVFVKFLFQNPIIMTFWLDSVSLALSLVFLCEVKKARGQMAEKYRLNNVIQCYVDIISMLRV